MIRHASYVACDECGAPAGVTVDGYQEARAIARHEGFLYVRASSLGAARDLCQNCRPDRPLWCDKCGSTSVAFYYDFRKWFCRRCEKEVFR